MPIPDVSTTPIYEGELPDVDSMSEVTDVRVITATGSGSEKVPIGEFKLPSSQIPYNPSVSGLEATNTKEAIDELTAKVNTKENAANKKTIINDSDTEFPTSKAVKTALDLKVDDLDVKNMLPAVNYYKRMAALGATIDKTALLKSYMETMSRQANTQIMYIPQVGMVERTSGVNKYATRLGDMSVNNNDAVQSTEATQGFVGGYIAPNEMRCLKFTSGQTQTGLINFTTPIVKAATDSWTLRMRVKINKKGSTRIYLGANGYIALDALAISLSNGTTTLLTTSALSIQCGRTITLEFQYSNGVGLIKANEVQLTTTALSGGITFDRISYNPTYPFDGSIYSFSIFNARASESESTQSHTFLSAMFPDIESVTIGNQVWSTDNFAGTVAGDGTAIPEVQSAATAADATNIYNATYAATSGSAAVKDLAATKAASMWCHYGNLAANGAVYGKLYNWYAVHLFDLYPPVKGWRVPSKLDFDQLVANQGGLTVAGGKLKAKFGGFDNANASNESGFSAVPGGYRQESGSFDNSASGVWTAQTEPATAAQLMQYFPTGESTSVSGRNKARFQSLRLLRNEPAGDNEKSYTSGLFTTDTTSTPKQIPISFGRMVDAIRIKSENALTAIEAKLYNAAGTAVATLITAKTIGAGETKMFTIGAVDYVGLPQDGTVRVTAAGNSGAAVGMEIEVLTHKGVLS